MTNAEGSTELLAALADRLVAGLRDRGETAPITIGSILQKHLPYRSVRSELGILEFAAYEHLLLRLLGGEGGRVTVLDASVREDIATELRSSNPILGVYRDYSGTRVSVMGVTTEETGIPPAEPPVVAEAPKPREVADLPDSADPGSVDPGSAGPSSTTEIPRELSASPPAPDPEVGEGEPEALHETREADRGAREFEQGALEADPGGRDVGQESQGAIHDALQADLDHREVEREHREIVHHPEDSTGVDSEDDVEEGHCLNCQRALPDIHRIRFCPFCGVSRGPIPCDRCGTILEGGWMFCIRCGADAEPVRGRRAKSG